MSQPGLTFVRQADPHNAHVVRVVYADDESRSLGPVDKANNGVVANHEVLREIGDCRPSSAAVAADRKQQLVHRRRKTCLSGCTFAPSKKSAKSRPKPK